MTESWDSPGYGIFSENDVGVIHSVFPEDTTELCKLMQLICSVFSSIVGT